jgi:PAS domain S-box-containing protein
MFPSSPALVVASMVSMSTPKLPSPAPPCIEDSFRVFLDAAPDAMQVVDEHGHIVFANRQTEQLFGDSGSELLGRKIDVLIPTRFRAKHTAHREGYFARNPHVRPMGGGLNLCGVRKDGTEFPVEISLSPIQTPHEQWSSAEGSATILGTVGVGAGETIQVRLGDSASIALRPRIDLLEAACGDSSPHQKPTRHREPFFLPQTTFHRCNSIYSRS